ncbi:hypothetical protein [Embleya sp. NBC_00896]|uniref:hypothetical protein n=1 Tax=Embleya sp. NBC_00896 TaxID=2975961 RepID=UPI0038689DEC|nr:hypothetical protein OG928_25605 [Embleya sp. NBC_00896]
MANEITYGTRIHLLNGYKSFNGGYLDSINPSPLVGAKYGVATSDSPDRGIGTGTWEVQSASGKAVGQPVESGDLIYLRNLYGGDGGYLDTNNHASTLQQSAGAKYDVSTSQTKDRAPGTGRWRIFAQTSSPQDRYVRAGDVVHLWNTYGDNGGFLETNNVGPAGDKYDVCTNAYYNRADHVADWRISTA